MTMQDEAFRACIVKLVGCAAFGAALLLEATLSKPAIHELKSIRAILAGWYHRSM